MKSLKALILLSVFCVGFILSITGSLPAQEKQWKTMPETSQEKPKDSVATIDLKGFKQKDLSVTHHTLVLDGKPLKYTTIAGYMPIQDEKDTLKAKIFFISYTLDGVTDVSKRPLTFAYNGGPGSSSLWLHFGALGPKRAKLTEIGELPHPPYTFVDNQETWLEFTDVVMIDPVDTGFSRVADEKDMKNYMGVREDVKSVGNFIRLYTTLYKRWKSPKYICGESYGAIRNAGLAEYLQDDVGMHLNGLIFVSEALNFLTIDPFEGNDIPFALALPTYTASAFYHKRLAPALQANLQTTLKEVERWAMTDYLLALAKGNTISDQERDAVAEKLAYYTGLPKSYILKSNLRVQPYRFRKDLLSDKGLIMGYYDGRLTGVDPDPMSTNWPVNDPTFFLSGPFMTSVNDYFRNDLKYINDLPYHTFSPNSDDWNWKSGSSGGFTSPNESSKLSWAMNNNPYLKVFVACGYYDLCTPHLSALYSMNHLRIAPNLKKNIQYGFYEGGHMMYTNTSARKKLRDDIRAFYGE